MRILLIDWTKFGNGTATGQIKSTYFSIYAPGSILHLYAADHQRVGAAPDGDWKHAKVYGTNDRTLDRACDEFAPDLILYRPVADRPAFHDVAMRIIRGSSKPLATWMMDDWPERLRESDPKSFIGYDAALRELFARAKVNLAICESMAAAYKLRYGKPFAVFRNGVEASEWPERPAKPKKPGSPILLRYAGGLAADMNRAAVHETAVEVEKLGARFPVKMEINTSQHWFQKESAEYSKFKHVTISNKTYSDDDYKQWLRDADILLIAYNFDNTTINYTRHSFANKTPECLASGAAVLAYGPRQIATLDFLARRSAAVNVNMHNADMLRRKIKDLVSKPEHRKEIADAGRQAAFSHLALDRQRHLFLTMLHRAAGLPGTPKIYKAPPPKPAPVEAKAAAEAAATPASAETAAARAVSPTPSAALAKAKQDVAPPTTVESSFSVPLALLGLLSAASLAIAAATAIGAPIGHNLVLGLLGAIVAASTAIGAVAVHRLQTRLNRIVAASGVGDLEKAADRDRAQRVEADNAAQSSVRQLSGRVEELGRRLDDATKTFSEVTREQKTLLNRQVSVVRGLKESIAKIDAGRKLDADRTAPADAQPTSDDAPARDARTASSA